MKIVCIERLEAFAELRDEWEELFDATPGATPFFSHDWLEAWWGSFGSRGEPLVLLASDDAGRLRNAWALLRRRVPVLRFRFLRSHDMMGAGHSDYVTVLGDREHLVESCEAFFHHLVHRSPSWDTMHLVDFATADVAPRLIADAARARGWSGTVTEGESTVHVPLPSDVDSFRAGLSGNLRRWLNRKRRSVERDLGASFRRLDEGDDLDRAVEDLFRLHRSRHAELGRLRPLAEEASRRFHHRVIHAFARRGWLELHFLDCEGGRRAALYGFNHRRVMYSYLHGFDPEIVSYSPGTLMLDHWFRSAVERNMRECDLLRGASEYKARWGGEIRRNRDVIVVRNRARYGIHWTLQRVRTRLARDEDAKGAPA